MSTWSHPILSMSWQFSTHWPRTKLVAANWTHCKCNVGTVVEDNKPDQHNLDLAKSMFPASCFLRSYMYLWDISVFLVLMLSSHLRCSLMWTLSSLQDLHTAVGNPTKFCKLQMEIKWEIKTFTFCSWICCGAKLFYDAKTNVCVGALSVNFTMLYFMWFVLHFTVGVTWVIIIIIIIIIKIINN